MLQSIKIIKTTKKGRRVWMPLRIERMDGRIFFHSADQLNRTPFELKNDIKAMRGSRFHGYLENDGRKIWSVEDCCRNNFRLEYMQGGNPYANWDQPLKHWDYDRPLFNHQKWLSDCCLTYHYQILAAEMGVGKSLSAIEVMEKSGVFDWWYVAPKSGIEAVQREWSKWGLRLQPTVMTYERLRIIVDQWESGMPAPQGVIFDESSRLKSASAKRTKAGMHLADTIRKEYGWEGYVILMSGTPAPKSPVDWWSQCEICYPGFLKEGNPKAFEWRLAFFEKQRTESGDFWKRTGWRDDENKCDKCGRFEFKLQEDGYPDCDDKGALILDPIHNCDDIFGMGENSHAWEPSKNEVAYLAERLNGLVRVLKKKDCLSIPDKIYREIRLEPTSTLKRVAKGLAAIAQTTIQGITWLRELSDGFQYRRKQKGMETCSVCKGKGECEQWDYTDITREPVKEMGECKICGGTGEVPSMERDTKEIKCPKEGAIKMLLEECEDQGRIVIFAGFQGSIDKLTKLCHNQEWDVVKVDSRGWKVLRKDGEPVGRDVKPLDYWEDMQNERVAFVAHPASGGMGLTLTQSRMAVFYSNDFAPESRMQGEDRIHRPGMDENRGATIVDLFHLGTDRRVLSVLRDNRRLESMTLEELKEALDE